SFSRRCPRRSLPHLQQTLTGCAGDSSTCVPDGSLTSCSGSPRALEKSELLKHVQGCPASVVFVAPIRPPHSGHRTAELDIDSDGEGIRELLHTIRAGGGSDGDDRAGRAPNSTQ